jgi:hypothetical protein
MQNTLRKKVLAQPANILKIREKVNNKMQGRLSAI